MADWETICADEVNGPLCELYDTTNGIVDGVNTFFLLFAGTLVFLMQSGFAMLCAGSVRQKNVKNIMLKNLLDACGGAVGFWSVGYAFAYGGADPDVVSFIGLQDFLLLNFTTGPEYMGWFFQFAFAATAATIVAGTVAERCRMSAYLCYSFFLTAFVYPIIVRSIWSTSGFLSPFTAEPFRGSGVIDFAGSGVVHLTGGTTALVATLVLGPRKGRFHDEEGNPLDKPRIFPAHSTALQMLGTFILWLGWYGFNPGSALVIANSDSAAVSALAAVTTTIAGAAGCVTSMFTDTIIDSMKTGEASYDLKMAMNGCLGGLVAITSCCATVTPWAALIIGMGGGLSYCCASKLLIKLRIDDAVDAIPVHLANGIWGLLAAGLFSNPDNMALAGYNTDHTGWFYSFGDANLLLCQFCAVCWIIIWVTAVMTPFFVFLNLSEMFRVDPLEEAVGLDYSGPKEEDVKELMEECASKHGKVEGPNEVSEAAMETTEHEPQSTESYYGMDESVMA